MKEIENVYLLSNVDFRKPPILRVMKAPLLLFLMRYEKVCDDLFQFDFFLFLLLLFFEFEQSAAITIVLIVKRYILKTDSH